MARSRIDYELKAEVISSGLHNEIGRIDRNDYIMQVDGIVNDKDNDSKFVDLLMQYGGKWIKEARKINHASYKRIERLRDRIFSYLSFGKCKFITLTFTDDVLNNTTLETRRQYVSRFFKSISDYYVANIDFGNDHFYLSRKGLTNKGTNREHYHGIAVCDWHEGTWQYGWILTETIKFNNHTSTKIGKYVAKLTNHAIKKTTKRQCYIYSRTKL